MARVECSMDTNFIVIFMIVSPLGSDVLFLSLLDGTTNFAHGYPSFSVSIGVLFRGKPAAATVVCVCTFSLKIWIFFFFAN
jgi:hypothetical protein